MNHVAAGKVIKKTGDSRAEKRLGKGIDKVIGVVKINTCLPARNNGKSTTIEIFLYHYTGVTEKIDRASFRVPREAQREMIDVSHAQIWKTAYI
jgi:hypothetical protein